MEIKNQIKTFRDIIAWQKPHQLVIEVYRITKNVPENEKFGLVSQMRRAIVSVACNIVEGFARKNIGETLNFYNIANASLEELKYQFLICRDVDLIKIDACDELVNYSSEVGRTLNVWINSQKVNAGLSCYFYSSCSSR